MLDALPPLSPLHFFGISLDCFSFKEGALLKKHQLPDFSDIHGAKSFATLNVGWSEEGILIYLTQNRTDFTVYFPHFSRGDSYEFFFDTRDIKTTGYNTRFCHHFYFLPEPSLEGGENVGGEITRFRGEEAHDLCDRALLKLTTLKKEGRTTTEIFVPKEALYGYDPTQFDRLGFTYRLNHRDGRMQHFACDSLRMQIDDQPSLWASLLLKKEATE